MLQQFPCFAGVNVYLSALLTLHNRIGAGACNSCERVFQNELRVRGCFGMVVIHEACSCHASSATGLHWMRWPVQQLFPAVSCAYSVLRSYRNHTRDIVHLYSISIQILNGKGCVTSEENARTRLPSTTLTHLTFKLAVSFYNVHPPTCSANLAAVKSDRRHQISVGLLTNKLPTSMISFPAVLSGSPLSDWWSNTRC